MNRPGQKIPESVSRAGSEVAEQRAGMCAVIDRPDAAVIVNADDWGRDAATTDRILECILHGVVSSTSAMVFMEDSQRAAELARQQGVDAGLHLNLTIPFTSPACPARLVERQQKLARFLRSHRLAPILYRPDLADSFAYVVQAQLEEYQRLYGAAPHRVDGHHHMHLCNNVLFQRLLPCGTIARRNFTFAGHEKGFLNRFYRDWQDRKLAQRHRIADFFFDLCPMDPERLGKIFALAGRFNVELETHPSTQEEYEFLMNGGLARCAHGAEVARGYNLRSSGAGAGGNA